MSGATMRGRIDPRSMTLAQLDQARWRPAGSIAIRPKGVDCVAYWGESARGGGRVYVVAYRGRALKHCAHYGFRTKALAIEWVTRWAEGLRKNAEASATRAAERKAYRHSLQVGDVLRSSWGYDQTNIDYYQVTRRSASCVWIREIRALSSGGGGMTGDCVPEPGSFKGEEKRHRVLRNNAVKIESFAYAYKIEPRDVAGVKVFSPDRWSAYA